MYGANSPCMICHDKSGRDSREAIIEQLVYELQRIDDSIQPVKLDWSRDVHSRCRYGMSCSSLRQRDTHLRDRARHLDGKIMHLIEMHDPFINEVLYRLQGHFPYVYNQIVAVKQKYEAKDWMFEQPS